MNSKIIRVCFVLSFISLYFSGYVSAQLCSDSDGGLEYSIHGVIRVEGRNGPVTGDQCSSGESCSGPGCLLYEAYCSDSGDYDFMSVSCPQGCVRGVCKGAENSSQDLDSTLESGVTPTIDNFRFRIYLQRDPKEFVPIFRADLSPYGSVRGVNVSVYNQHGNKVDESFIQKEANEDMVHHAFFETVDFGKQYNFRFYVLDSSSSNPFGEELSYTLQIPEKTSCPNISPFMCIVNESGQFETIVGDCHLNTRNVQVIRGNGMCTEDEEIKPRLMSEQKYSPTIALPNEKEKQDVDNSTSNTESSIRLDRLSSRLKNHIKKRKDEIQRFYLRNARTMSEPEERKTFLEFIKERRLSRSN